MRRESDIETCDGSGCSVLDGLDVAVVMSQLVHQCDRIAAYWYICREPERPHPSPSQPSPISLPPCLSNASSLSTTTTWPKTLCRSYCLRSHRLCPQAARSLPQPPHRLLHRPRHPPQQSARVYTTIMLQLHVLLLVTSTPVSACRGLLRPDHARHLPHVLPH